MERVARNEEISQEKGKKKKNNSRRERCRISADLRKRRRNEPEKQMTLMITKTVKSETSKWNRMATNKLPASWRTRQQKRRMKSRNEKEKEHGVQKGEGEESPACYLVDLEDGPEQTIEEA
jgi:hypothetical protein